MTNQANMSPKENSNQIIAEYLDSEADESLNDFPKSADDSGIIQKTNSIRKISDVNINNQVVEDSNCSVVENVGAINSLDLQSKTEN